MASEYSFPVIDAGGSPEQVEAAVWDLVFPLVAERYPNIVSVEQKAR